MTAQPEWSPVDDDTADLLSLVAVGPMSTGAAEREWLTFTETLAWVAHNCGGQIWPNDLRPRLRGDIAPQRIGAFTNRAIAQKLIEPTGEWQVSDDREGRNGGKPARCYRWIGGDQ